MGEYFNFYFGFIQSMRQLGLLLTRWGKYFHSRSNSYTSVLYSNHSNTDLLVKVSCSVVQTSKDFFRFSVIKCYTFVASTLFNGNLYVSLLHDFFLVYINFIIILYVFDLCGILCAHMYKCLCHYICELISLLTLSRILTLTRVRKLQEKQSFITTLLLVFL